MTRLRLLFVTLAIVSSLVAVRLVWTATHREDERSADGTAARTATHAARIAARSAMHAGGGPAAAVAEVAPAAPVAPANALTGVEKRFADAGLSRGEAIAMKQAFPDWQTRFASASDDMLKAHASRVQHLIPVQIADEVSHVGSVDVLAKSGLTFGDDVAVASGGAHLGDDALRAGAASGVLDDVARSGGTVIDDVARGGASMLDDLLRVLGLGAAGAAAAGGAALSKRKK